MLSLRSRLCPSCPSHSLQQAAAVCRPPASGGARLVAASQELWAGQWVSRRAGLQSPTVCSAIKARWCIDAKYGCKADVTSLLQEWVVTVGASAGLTHSNAQLSTGAIGIPESRLELEVSLDSLSAWEAFLEGVPAQEHRAWSQRMQGMVVDGSPVWHVYRLIPINKAEEHSVATGAARSQPGKATRGAALEPLGTAAGSSSTLYLPTGDALGTLESQLNSTLGTSKSSLQGSQAGTMPATSASSAPSGNDDDEGEIVLDWKGEPMKINKGDKMPRFL